jgi:hypothetical protein
VHRTNKQAAFLLTLLVALAKEEVRMGKLPLSPLSRAQCGLSHHSPKMEVIISLPSLRSRSLSWISVSDPTAGVSVNVAIMIGMMTIGDIVTTMTGDIDAMTAVAR